MGSRTRLASCTLIFLIIFVIAQYRADGACRRGWEAFRRKCYLYVKQHETFTDAVNYCARRGAQILDITSETENAFVTRLITKEGKGHRVWLSIVQRARDGQWLSHSSGQPMSFAKWDAGQPSAYLKPDADFQNCAVLKPDYGLWSDVPCGYTKHFVCEARKKP